MSEFLSDISAYFATLTLMESVWLGIGFFGQSLFFSRWVIQWIASERKAESQMPLAFWYMSLGGGLIVFVYAIHRRDPVFIVGQPRTGTTDLHHMLNQDCANHTERLWEAANPVPPPQ